MRFCDKLAKQRKNNNLSQEQLADKLGMSRQAISKWESGSSYPDMDKMLQLCKILNCHLEELMDDGVIGTSDSSKKKFSFDNLIKDSLNFITRSYNMFCSMGVKEKIKLLFELLFIGLFLIIIGFITFSVVDHFVLRIFIRISYIGEYFYQFFSNLLAIFLIIVGLIIFLHLYKIRYLDYYITVEDASVSTRVVEEPVDKKDNNYCTEKVREKVIIRDPKHSTFSFFEAIGKVIIIIIKFFAILFIIPIMLLFVLLVAGFCMSFIHIGYNIVCLWMGILLFGCIAFTFVAFDFMYNFIFNREICFKRNFYILLISLIIIGVGAGFATIRFLHFNYASDYSDFSSNEIVKEFSIDKNTILNLDYYNPTYIIDNSLSNAVIKVNSIKPYTYNLVNHDRHILLYQDGVSISELYRLILNDLKANVIRNYDYNDCVSITISLNEKDYNLLNIK